MVGVYKITSPSGKIYIGQSWNISKRKSAYKRNPSIQQRHIYNSIIKYGWEAHSFEILQKLPVDIEQSVLDNLECFYIEQYKSANITLMNIKEGGSRGKVSEETLERMRNTTHGRDFMKEYNQRIDRYRRPKGFWEGKRHPREYKVEQTDLSGNLTKVWNSISEIKKELGYNSSNLSMSVRKQIKYKNSYWKRIQ